MDLQAACRAVVEEADAWIKTKLVKRAIKHGLTEAEAIEIAEAWKLAARHTKHLHPKRSRH